MFKLLTNLSNRAVLSILIWIMLATNGAALVANLLNTAESSPWWVTWLQNLGTQTCGAFLIFWLLLVMLGARQEQQRLIRQLGSTAREDTRGAVEALRERDWLENGSLQEAELELANLERTNLSRADLQRASFAGANLHAADLGHANLQAAHLGHANLQGASLHQAILKEANLYNANLHRAILVDANLQAAHLSGANLQGANLSRANLQTANLTDANLHAASLLHADLRGTSLSNANLQAADLSHAQFDANTALPDGSQWTAETDLTRFTDPTHVQFWRPEPDEHDRLPLWYKGRKSY